MQSSGCGRRMFEMSNKSPYCTDDVCNTFLIQEPITHTKLQCVSKTAHACIVALMETLRYVEGIVTENNMTLITWNNPLL